MWDQIITNQIIRAWKYLLHPFSRYFLKHDDNKKCIAMGLYAVKCRPDSQWNSRTKYITIKWKTFKWDWPLGIYYALECWFSAHYENSHIKCKQTDRHCAVGFMILKPFCMTWSTHFCTNILANFVQVHWITVVSICILYAKFSYLFLMF